MGRLKALPYRTKLPASRAPRRLESPADSWRQGKTTAERGYDGRWQKAREGYLRHHPLCVHCLNEGRTTEATDVDHIVPHRGDKELFWDKDNWQSMCHACHSRKTAIEKRTSYC